MPRIQILSDLHIDASNFTPEICADILIIAGDVTGHKPLLEDFFYYRLARGLPTIFVAGNHEYEYNEFHETNEFLKKLCSEYGITYLFNETHIQSDVRFIGTPLFSNLRGFYDRYKPGEAVAIKDLNAIKEWVTLNVSDFKKIQVNRGNGETSLWTVDDCIEQFEIAHTFLQEELNKPFDGKTVVVTHFPPLFEFSKPDVPLKEMPMNSFWANHIPNTVALADYWICGHSHIPKVVQHEKCQVICNPRGVSFKSNISENGNFQQKFFLDL